MKSLLIGIAGAMLAAGSALADPASAIRAYDAGLFDVAAREFHREALAGDLDAQFRLGTMYADGVWFGKDRAMAVEWLGKAAIQGHQGAVEKLEALYRGESGEGRG